MLFPWFGMIPVDTESPIDIILQLDHEEAHTRLDFGYWLFHNQIDLLAKLLLEVVCEQGCDPAGLLEVSLDLWGKLGLLAQHGFLVDEAIALDSLVEENAAEHLWQSWCFWSQCFRELFGWDDLADPTRGDFTRRVEQYKSSIRHLTGAGDSCGHGEVFRGLERLRDDFSMSYRTRLHLLLLANRVLVDEAALVAMPVPELRRKCRSDPFRFSRNHRFRCLVEAPGRFHRQHKAAYQSMCRNGESSSSPHLLQAYYRPLHQDQLLRSAGLESRLNSPVRSVILDRYQEYSLDVPGAVSWRQPKQIRTVSLEAGEHTRLFAMYPPPLPVLSLEELEAYHAYHAFMTACQLRVTLPGIMRVLPPESLLALCKALEGSIRSLGYPRLRGRLLYSFASYLTCKRLSERFSDAGLLAHEASCLKTYIRLADEVGSPASIKAVRMKSLPKLEEELAVLSKSVRRQ